MPTYRIGVIEEVLHFVEVTAKDINRAREKAVKAVTKDPESFRSAGSEEYRTTTCIEVK